MMFTIKPKKCKICNKEFMPASIHQIYCKDLHYRICPICGESYAEPNLDKFKFPPTTCSMKCRVIKRTKTSLDKYGVPAPGNNPIAREKAKITMNAKYGVDYALESPELQQKAKNTWLIKYGVDNPQKCQEIQEKTCKTNLKKYGSKTYLNSKAGKELIDEIMLNKYGTTIPLKNMEIRQRQKETNLQKYGVEYPTVLPETKEKAKQTSLLRYGTEYPQSSEIVKCKTKDTFIKNYGVDNCFKAKEIIKKIKQSFYDRYGVHSVMEAEEIASKIRETNMKKYGVPYYVMLPNVSRSSGRISKINRSIEQKLNAAGIFTRLEFSIDKYSYDIKIPQGNILIEINPTYTHSTVGNHWNPKGINKNYHLNKTLLAQDHGYRCIHLWDWDSINKFINLLTNKHTIYTSIYPEIISQTEAEDFITQYSLYDVSKNIFNVVYIGIRYKSKLMSIIGFKQTDPILNTWEIINIDNRFNYIVYGGNLAILDDFIHRFNPSKITAYADFSKTNGEILENMGFEYTRFILPNKLWSKGRHAIADGIGISPEEMISDHWLPVYNCGYKVYEKVLHTTLNFSI